MMGKSWNLHNIGVETQKIKPGDKIAQAVLVPVAHCGIEEVTEDTPTMALLVVKVGLGLRVIANGQTIQESQQKKGPKGKEAGTDKLVQTVSMFGRPDNCSISGSLRQEQQRDG